MESYIKLLIFLQCYVIVNSQRVAPGVPPNQYMPPNPNVQQHQVPVQPQYQVPQQHIPQQHVPQQQHIPQQHVPQQHIPQQHVPQQQVSHQHVQNHGHAGGHQNPQVLNPGNIAHEKEHIAEHLKVPIDTSKMSDQELQFHYFKMHDADNNNKLDGCELIKSLIHWHEEGSRHRRTEDGQQDPNQIGDKIFSDEELIGLIDPILNMDDGNKDGYIDYPEFVRAQQKAQAQHQQGNN